MRQWAISVGINSYHFFQPLSYAQRDAQVLWQFLIEEAGFSVDHCLLLTDTSPPMWGKSTYPDRQTLQNWLDLLIQHHMQPGDVLWFFFSGYGVAYQGQDYLMPVDGNPTALIETAIPMQMLYQALKKVATETVLVLLDVNRNEGAISQEPMGK